MQEIFNFLRENWQVIASVITLIISVVVAIIRKKPVDTIFSAIFKCSLEAVKEAENTGLKGLEKLRYCVGLVEACLKANYPNINPISYYGYIVDVIEDILTTPQKKGE